MNILFTLIFITCAVFLLICAPQDFLPALLDGASKAATLCFTLIASYAVWMGLMRVWEDSGLSTSVSKLLKPLAKKILKTEDEPSLCAACMNFSVNMLGISGAATPYGVKAAQLLDKTENAEYSSAMFFVLNATSLQLLPTSIIGVRVAMGSLSPMDIVIPTALTSLFCTLLGVLLSALFLRPKQADNARLSFPKMQKNKGAGI